MLETSPTDRPFCKICTRGPSRPRITGRDDPAPYPVADTPSSLAIVAPRVVPNLLRSSSPCKILVGVKMLCTASCEPVAVTSSEVCDWATAPVLIRPDTRM